MGYASSLEDLWESNVYMGYIWLWVLDLELSILDLQKLGLNVGKSSNFLTLDVTTWHKFKQY